MDCLTDLRGDSHGSEIASRICQEGLSAKKEQGTPEIPCFHIHSYTDASFATSSRKKQIRLHGLFWSIPKRAVILFCSGPREGKPSLHTRPQRQRLTPQLKIAMRTDSDTGLKQLRNDSIVVRTRPFGKCYSYLRDVCYGTLLYPPCVDPVFEPGKTQKADGLTKILGRNLQLALMSHLGMKVPSYL